MKLLIDMNLSPRWVNWLASANLEATHWSTVGRANAADAEIMQFARAHNLVVVTHDLDFSAILAATQGAKPSVVQLRADDVRPETIGRQVVVALTQLAPLLEEGALLTTDPGSHQNPGLAPLTEKVAPLLQQRRGGSTAITTRSPARSWLLPAE